MGEKQIILESQICKILGLSYGTLQDKEYLGTSNSEKGCEEGTEGKSKSKAYYQQNWMDDQRKWKREDNANISNPGEQETAVTD